MPVTCGYVLPPVINISVTHVTLSGVSAGHGHDQQAITLLSIYNALTRGHGRATLMRHGEAPRNRYDCGEVAYLHQRHPSTTSLVQRHMRTTLTLFDRTTT